MSRQPNVTEGLVRQPNIAENLDREVSYAVFKTLENPKIKDNYVPEPEKQIDLKYTDAGSAPFEYQVDGFVKLIESTPKQLGKYRNQLLNFAKSQAQLYKKFQAQESNELRKCLATMCVCHLMYIFLFRSSWLMILADSGLFFLCYKCLLKLQKPMVFLYILTMVLITIVGLTHAPYRWSFKSGYHQAIYVIQLLFYISAASWILIKLKDHILIQETIRIVNYNQNIQGRVKLRLRDTVGPKIADILKERVEEIMSDPDEQLFYNFKNSKYLQYDSNEEMEYQMALINSEKRIGHKMGSKMDQFIKHQKEVRKERRKNFLAKFAKKKEELKPLDDEVYINSEHFKQSLEELNAEEDLYDSEDEDEFLDAEEGDPDNTQNPNKKKKFKFGDGARFLKKQMKKK